MLFFPSCSNISEAVVVLRNFFKNTNFGWRNDVLFSSRSQPKKEKHLAMLGFSPFGHCWLTNSFRQRHRGAPKRGMNEKASNLIRSVEKHAIRQEWDDGLGGGRDRLLSLPVVIVCREKWNLGRDQKEDNWRVAWYAWCRLVYTVLPVSSTIGQLVCFVEEGYSGEQTSLYWSVNAVKPQFLFLWGWGLSKCQRILRAAYWRPAILRLYAFLCSPGIFFLKQNMTSCSHKPFLSVCISLICPLLLEPLWFTAFFLSGLGDPVMVGKWLSTGKICHHSPINHLVTPFNKCIWFYVTQSNKAWNSGLNLSLS